jgi:hypothetical protein
MLADLARPLDETLLSDPVVLPLLIALSDILFEKHEFDEFCRWDLEDD